VDSIVDSPDITFDPRSHLPAFLATPELGTHAVQFYERENFLFDTASKFLAAGLAAGEHIDVFATRRHSDGIFNRIDPRLLEQAREGGRIRIFDARTTLAEFMVGDMPDARRFHEFVNEILSSHPKTALPSRRGFRAFGEMVDVLAKEGNVRAAIRLEALWHERLQAKPFPLLCAYSMGTFFRPGDSERLMELFASHSHVIPTETFVSLKDPDQRRREVALLQQRGRVLKSEVDHRKKLERALADTLRDLSRVEEELLGWVQREQEARQRAEASEAFKEKLLGALGHDLRNPLNTILATVRMMTLRKELEPRTQARLERVVTSGTRMHRMIEQLLEVADARGPEGIPARTALAHDLAPLVRKIADEVGASTPSRRIELSASVCHARVDIERFEQMVWSLLSYAVAGADAASVIRVHVLARGASAVVGVATDDVFIDSAQLPHLFDSLHLDIDIGKGMDSLQLGLYLAKRTATSYGGEVRASCSDETGTRLEAILPLA
jgi:signal transduction histidine kinase